MVRYKTTKTKTFFKIKRIKNKEKKLLKSKRKFVRQRTKTETNEIKNKINKKQIPHMSIKTKNKIKYKNCGHLAFHFSLS